MEYFTRKQSWSLNHAFGRCPIKAAILRRFSPIAIEPIETWQAQCGEPLSEIPYSAMCDASSVCCQTGSYTSCCGITIKSSIPRFTLSGFLPTHRTSRSEFGLCKPQDMEPKT